METSICYTDKQHAYVSSDERRWINKLRDLRQKFPDYVRIDHEPETNDGCICATIPVNWVKIQPGRALTMTDNQRQAAAERLKNNLKSPNESAN